MKTALVSGYHPLLVTLHWLLAVLIIAMLCIGFLVLAPMPSTDPQKIGILLVHMSIGMAILALMVARFIVRIRTSRPADATTGHPRLDRLAPIIHYGFYVLVLLMVGSGYATAILAGIEQKRVPGFRRSAAAGLFDLSDLGGARYAGCTSCRLHCLARACRAFSPVRPQGRTVAADVVWPARANVSGAGEIIGQKSKAPSDDRSCIGLSGLLG